MEFIIIGIVSALNLIVIVHKFKKGRIEDGIFDSILFTVMASLFSGSYGGMVVAMISSLIISIYLLASPPKFFKSFANREDVKEAIEKLKEKPKTRRKSEDIDFD
jgi:spore maturation protein CgeB